MKYSIIIPCFNNPEQLDRLLKSIREADFSEHEVIVIDDRSDCLSSIKCICDSYDFATLRINNGTKGAGSCRNIGMRAAKGEWFLFADSDDRFLKGSFKTISDSINNNIGADIIYHSPTSPPPYTRNASLTNLVEECIEKNTELVRYWFVVPWSKIISRSLVITNNILFSEKLVANDIYFGVKCGVYAKTIALNKSPFYEVSVSENSLTSKTDYSNLYLRYVETIKVNNLLKNNGKGKYTTPEFIFWLRLWKKNHKKAIYDFKPSKSIFPTYFVLMRKFAKITTKK